MNLSHFVRTAAIITTLATTLFAQNKIGAYPIPLMVVDPDNGVFIELTKEIIKRSGETFAISVAPPKRTVGEFHSNVLQAFFPALDVLISKDVAKSDEIYVKRDFAFYKSDSPALTTLTSLKGKKVGITSGYPYAAELMTNKEITLVESNSDVINMKNLSAGRIDVFIVEEKTGLKALQESAVTNVKYDAATPLSEQKVYYAFQADAAGKASAGKFSTALADMKKDGTFAKIMSKAEQQK